MSILPQHEAFDVLNVLVPALSACGDHRRRAPIPPRRDADQEVLAMMQSTLDRVKQRDVERLAATLADVARVRAQLLEAVAGAKRQGFELAPHMGIRFPPKGHKRCCVLGAVLIHLGAVEMLPWSSGDDVDVVAIAALLLDITQYRASSIAHGFDNPTDDETTSNPWILLGRELSPR